MNRELADQLKDRVYKNFDDDGIEDITEDIIIEAIEDLRLMKRFADITDEEVQVVINTIFYERGVQVDDIGESKYLKDGDNWSTWIRGDIKSKTEDFYFNRYKKYLLEYKNLPNKSVVQLEQDVMNIVDLVGNPNVDGDFTRRGLIIGEVQSGKTSNFLGVLNKCADYGYQIIVVLTSNNESLRKQTQIRLDEGFIGVKHLGAKRIKLGVGKIKHADDKSPYTLTSDKTDFKTKLANEKNITPGQLASGTPIVIVAKKNITTLNNIKEWFERNGFSKSSGIDFPMLLIDDEADNASINVSGNVEKPTAINDIIRDLLSSFKKNSYVGYTATPYANIFINQNNGDEREDLFPKDYIFVLNTPSQYVGVF